MTQISNKLFSLFKIGFYLFIKKDKSNKVEPYPPTYSQSEAPDSQINARAVGMSQKDEPPQNQDKSNHSKPTLGENTQSQNYQPQSRIPSDQPGVFVQPVYAQPVYAQPVYSQPVVVAINSAGSGYYGRYPIKITCSYCQHQVVTQTHHKSGLLTWLIVFIVCLM